jgi:tRNA A-37 threonylcarbamoyl transferase component Bud32
MGSAAWTHLIVGGESARVRFADAASEAALGRRLAALCRPADCQGPEMVRVKTNASRTLWLCRLDGQAYYLKHYHSRSLAHRLGGWVRGDDADRELFFSQLLNARGVSAVEVLAVGRVAGGSWLISREVAPATPADVWHEQQTESGAAGAAAIRRVLAAVADLVAQMHEAGVSHRDLHAANILLAERDGDLTPVLMDLHRMFRGRRLSRRARAKDLALLMYDRWRLTTRTQRLAFLKRYLQACGTSDSLRSWAIQVAHFTEIHRRRLNASRDRRAKGDNKYFTRLRLPEGWRGHAVLATKRPSPVATASRLSFSAKEWRAALADPEKLFPSPDAVAVKESPDTLVVRRRLTVGPHVLDVHIKRVHSRRMFAAALALLRPSRVMRGFRLGHALLTRWIPAAMPLAVLERRRGGRLLEGIFITETVTPALPLPQFLERCLAKPPANEQPVFARGRRKLAQDLLRHTGQLLRKLHGEGFSHRDLKAGNLLVHSPPDGPARIVLIDLDGLTRPHCLSRGRMFRVMMRLSESLLECPAVNRAGRLRMLLAYLRRPGSGRTQFKPYWRELERRSNSELACQIAGRQEGCKQVSR